MSTSIADFVVDRLNDPGVSLSKVSEDTGIPLRTLQHLRTGNADNAWASRVELIARHFGFQLIAVPIRRRQRRAAADTATPAA